MRFFPFKHKEKKTINDMLYSNRNRFLDLRKTPVIEIHFGRIKLFVHTHWRSLSIVFVAFLSLSFVGGFGRVGHASLINFYPTSCLGGWEHPENAQGEPSLSSDVKPEDFTISNSARAKGITASMYCGGFKGTVPDNANPTNFKLTFYWSVDNGSVVHPEPQPFELPPVPSIDSTTNTTLPPTSSTPDPTPTIPDVSTPVVPPTPLPAPTPTTPDTPPKSPQSFLYHLAGTPVFAQNESPVAGDPFLEVDYTLDGTTWQTLGTINQNAWKNVSFDIPLNTWSSLNNLQISVKTLPTLDVSPVIYLDSMQIGVSYDNIQQGQTPPTILLKDSSSVISGSSDFSSGEDVAFTVTDPVLDNTKMRQLVDQNQAEVVKDTQGVLGVPTSVNKNISSDSNPIVPVVPAVPNVNTPTDLLQTVQNIVSPIITPAPAEQAPALEIIPVPSSTPDPTPTIPDVSTPVVPPTPLPAPTPTTPDTPPKSPQSFLYWFTGIARAQSSAPSTDTSSVSGQVLDASGSVTDISVTSETVFVGGQEKHKIHVQKPPRNFRPGKYTLKVTLTTPTAVIISQQDFTWGVLSVNTDKSIYEKGDTAYLQMGVLNDTGKTICDADLSLLITSPSGISKTLTTSDGSIIRNSECHGDTLINVPDYYAYYIIPVEVGTYQMVLTAVTGNGTKTIHDTFQVADNVPFVVSRIGPTRVFPESIYPMKIKITPVNDWTGTIVEKVPSNFEISSADTGIAYTENVTNGDTITLIWRNISLVKGQETLISYNFKPPMISPQFYLMGPLAFFYRSSDYTTDIPVFQEARQWQIADDAVCNATISGTWNTVNNGSMWSGCSGVGGVPSTSDDVTINSGVVVTLGAATPAVNSLVVAGTLTTSNWGLNSKTISISTTGILNANNAIITLSGTAAGTLLSITGSGVFNAGFSNVTITGAGSNTINSAGFTGSNALYVLTENISGVTKTLGGDITIINNLALQNGTFDTSSSNYSMSVGYVSLTSLSTVIFNGNSSTITLLGAASSGPAFNRGTASVCNTSSTNIVVSADTAVATYLFLSASVTTTFNNLTINPVLTATRTYAFFNGGGQTVTFNGNVDVAPSGGAYNLTINTGLATTIVGKLTVESSGSATSVVSASAALTIGSTEIKSGGTLTATNAISGTLNINSGGTFNPTGSFTLNGTSDTPFIVNGTFNPGTSTISFTGGHATTSVQIPGTTFYNLTLNKTGETFVLNSSNTVIGPLGLLSVIAGTLNTSPDGGTTSYNFTAGKISVSASQFLIANSSTITLNSTANTGNMFSISGTFTYGTSTVLINPDTAVLGLFSGTMTFYNLSLSPVLSASRSWACLTGNNITLAVNHNFTINPSSSSGSPKLTLTCGSVNGFAVAAAATFLMQPTAPATVEFQMGGVISVGNFDIESGATFTQSASASSAIVNGNTSTPLIVNGTFTKYTSAGSGGVTFTGGSGVTQVPGLNYLNLTFNSSGVTFVPVDNNINVDPTGALTVTLGTFNTNTTASAGDPTHDKNISVGKLSIAASQTFTANSSTITVTYNVGTLAFGNSGTFNYGTSTVIINADAAMALFNGTITFYNLSFSPVLSTNRSWNMFGSGGITITVTHNFTVNPSSSSGSPKLTIVNSAGNTFNVSAAATFLMQPTAPATVEYQQSNNFTTGNFDIESGATFTQSSTSGVTTVNGNTSTPLIVNGTFNKAASGGVGGVTFTGGSGNTQVPGINYQNLTFNSSGVTFIPVDNNINVDPTGTLTVTLGTFNTNTTASAGDPTHDKNISTGKISIAASQTFTPNNSIITLTGISGNLITKIGNLTSNTAEFVVTSASGSPTLINGSATTLHKLTINSLATVINQGSVVLTFDNATGAQFYIQSGVYNDMGQSIATTSGGTNATLKIGDPVGVTSGTLCLGGATTAATTATCDSSAVSTTARGMPTFGTYTFDSTLSTVIFLSDAALSSTNIPSAITYGNLKFAPRFVATPRTYTPQGALNVNGNFTIAPTNAAIALTVTMTGAITVASGKTLAITPTTATANLDTTASGCSSASCAVNSGNIDLETGGTLTGRAATITVSGNWTNKGTFTQNTSTVVLNSGTTATVSGTTTFNNLSITPAVAKEVDFTTASTPIYHVTGLFTATGHAGAFVKLRSDASPTKWQFHPTGTSSVSYVDVKDGGCQAGYNIIMPVTSLNSGNNEFCWSFVPFISFSVSNSTIGFGTLSPYYPEFCTADSAGSTSEVEANNMVVQAYSVGGYVLTVQGGSLSANGHTITPIGNSNLASTPGFEQFGLRAVASGGTGAVQAPYSGSGFGFAATSTTPSIVASESFGDGIATTYSLRYMANISPSTPGGKYTTTLTYIVTGSF